MCIASLAVQKHILPIRPKDHLSQELLRFGKCTCCNEFSSSSEDPSSKGNCVCLPDASIVMCVGLLAVQEEKKEYNDNGFFIVVLMLLSARNYLVGMKYWVLSSLCRVSTTQYRFLSGSFGKFREVSGSSQELSRTPISRFSPIVLEFVV